MIAPKIMVVEDEEPLGVLLKYNLEAEGYQVEVISRGDEAEIRLQENVPDLLVLDWMVPAVSGIELCRRLRMRPETERLPIIMLTAITETTDRVVGLEMGADDYVSKPFDPRELLARVRAVLRRLDGPGPDRRIEPQVYKFAGWTMDCSRRRLVSPDNVRVELTSGEFNLLETLVKSAQRMLSRDQLLELAGSNVAYGYDRSIDILISRLRRKMEDDPRSPKLILTIRGGGYQFVPEVVAE